MRNIRRWLVPSLGLVALRCSEPLCGDLGDSTARTGADGGSNVLVVLVDDVGVEAVGRWDLGPSVASTPVLDCLCDRGVRLTQTWASPVCSPTRGELQTGRYNRRLNLGGILRNGESGYALPLSEDTLAEVAGRVGYATGFFGKWHLGDSALPDAATHPNRSGYDRFAGTMGNLANSTEGLGAGYDFDRYEWVVDGRVQVVEDYVTSRTVDAALDFVDEVGDQPWLVVLSFHAPHVPLHTPPGDLVVQASDASQSLEVQQYQAMLQAADRELGRFLRGLGDTAYANTTILWLSDNGTPHTMLPKGLKDLGGKGSLQESGVRVPALIAGLAVEEAATAGQVSDALTHVVDVLPTVRDLVGGTSEATLDGLSWMPLAEAPDAPLHATVASAHFNNPGGVPQNLRRVLRDASHKLSVDDAGNESLFRVGPDTIDDGPDLLDVSLSEADEAALEGLRAELAALDASIRAGD